MASLLPQLRSYNGDLRPKTNFDMLQRQIDRLFDEFTGSWRMPEMFTDGDFALMPSVDYHDEGNKVVITAELPGVDEKDVDISVADQMVTISGEKKSMMEDRKGEQYRGERIYGKFSRSMSLPFDINPDKVEARFDKGVLTLSIEKPAEMSAKQRKIPIKH